MKLTLGYVHAEHRRVTPEARNFDIASKPYLPPVVARTSRKRLRWIRPERQRDRTPDGFETTNERFVSWWLRRVSGREGLDFSLENFQLSVGNKDRRLRQIWPQIGNRDEFNVRARVGERP